MKNAEKNSVLIVDDETVNIMTLTNILNHEYIVYAAKNGFDAVRIAKEKLPDVILLDVLMPEMSGHEVIFLLKNTEETRNIPVIFITSLATNEYEEKGLELGAGDYIFRPFSPAIVKLRVQNQIKIVNYTRALKNHAEHSSRAKNEFLSRMSHEMLTPMNVIIGMMQILKMQGISDIEKKYFDEIDTASHQLFQLINDVLDMSDMEYGIFKLSYSKFSFSMMMNTLLKDALRNAEKKNHYLEYKVDQSMPDIFTSDENRLSQVLNNILSNAIKFTPENGKIYINVSVLKEDEDIITLQIEIADSGIGISEKQQNVLFDVFEQADGSSTRKYGGIGIGLPLSKRIIEMMGGTIRVESELNKGAKFIFTCKMEKA